MFYEQGRNEELEVSSQDPAFPFPKMIISEAVVGFARLF